MKSLKIIGIFLVLLAATMLIIAFYSLIEDEEALVVLASYCIMLFLSAVYIGIGLAMIFYKKKGEE